VEKMRSENLSSQVNLSRILEGNVATLNAVKSFRQANEIWRQFAWISRQSGTQPFTDLCADCAAIDAIDLNTVWILARHDGALRCNLRPTEQSRSGGSFLAQCDSRGGSDAGEVLPASLSNSVAVGADTNAHTRSAKTDTSARLFVVTPTLDIALARSVSIGIAGIADDDTAFIARAPATAVFVAGHANVVNVALGCD
jgi:hypothetical protein